MTKKLISIIIPTYNEQENVPALYAELVKGLSKIPYRFEIIFIDDGSTDNTAKTIGTIARKDTLVKCIEFSRNFGKEAATSAGLHHAKGSAAIMMDADLQHPVPVIDQLIKKWEQGSCMVIGVRNNSNGTFLQKLGSYFFNVFLNAFSQEKVIPRATDFRLIDSTIIKEFNRFTERQRATRGILDWMGFSKNYVYFDAPERKQGKAGYGFFKKLRLAVAYVISQSLLPLKIAGYLGIAITLLSGLLGIFIITEQYILRDPLRMGFTGTSVLASMIIFANGIVLICLGIISLYIANIQAETSNRPLYIIKNKKNID